jgi:hypothetical protein
VLPSQASTASTHKTGPSMHAVRESCKRACEVCQCHMHQPSLCRDVSHHCVFLQRAVEKHHHQENRKGCPLHMSHKWQGDLP